MFHKFLHVLFIFPSPCNIIIPVLKIKKLRIGKFNIDRK